MLEGVGDGGGDALLVAEPLRDADCVPVVLPLVVTDSEGLGVRDADDEGSMLALADRELEEDWLGLPDCDGVSVADGVGSALALRLLVPDADAVADWLALGATDAVEDSVGLSD